MSRKPRLIAVIGPESSGSTHLAKLLTTALGLEWSFRSLQQFPTTEKDKRLPNKVFHASLPAFPDHKFIDIEAFEKNNKKFYERIDYVVCTRDITISEQSRRQRWPKRDFSLLEEHRQKAKSIIEHVLTTKRSMIWSYETFMFLKHQYLVRLFNFLEIDLKNIPDLNDIVDGNVKHINLSKPTNQTFATEGVARYTIRPEGISINFTK